MGTLPFGVASLATSISGFEVRVPSLRPDGQTLLLHVTILRIPGPRPDLFTLVHVAAASASS